MKTSSRLTEIEVIAAGRKIQPSTSQRNTIIPSLPPHLVFRFLTTSQIQRLHDRSVIPNAAATQPSLLDSAVHAPINLQHYKKEKDIFQLAANLAEKVMKNHAFHDGNKRTALAAADMFLRINGYSLREVPFTDEDSHNKEDITDAHVAVVTKECTAERLGMYYKSVAGPP
ncbi:hypothetical protein BJY04DRAFT_214566 [Aspergillus karnatakaensis]|uniref:type II toxin-antitoxin system death-on-curing family toxin n=1 Tax=Aspergillus karnatakaensis TaxID=1810916 RepID=UPI003CCD4595